MKDDGMYARVFLYSDHYMYFPPSIPAHHILIIVFTTDALNTPFVSVIPWRNSFNYSTSKSQNQITAHPPVINLSQFIPSMFTVHFCTPIAVALTVPGNRENPTIRLLLVYRYASCLDTSTHVNGHRIQRVEELSNCARSPSTATRTFIFHYIYCTSSFTCSATSPLFAYLSNWRWTTLCAELLLPDCIRFSCCSPIELIRFCLLLLPACVRFSCCSPLASTSTAAT